VIGRANHQLDGAYREAVATTLAGIGKVMASLADTDVSASESITRATQKSSSQSQVTLTGLK